MTKLNVSNGILIIGLLSLGLISGCGGVKVGLDQGTQDTLQCIVDNTCDNTGDTTGSDSGDAASTGGTEVAGSDFQGTSEDKPDSSGGIIVTEPDGYSNTSDRFFMGTFDANAEASYSYGNSCLRQYNFPSVIRGYSHNADDYIDFETSGGSLAWVAQSFEDETFDFSVRFLDSLGKPSVQLDCTCSIDPGYGNYTPDMIKCDCSGGSDGACPLYYQQMGNAQ